MVQILTLCDLSDTRQGKERVRMARDAGIQGVT